MAGARADSAQYYYDPAGRLTAMVDPVNGSAQYNYDAVGNILSVVRRPITDLMVAQLSPSRGQAGTVVTIAGTGFDSTADTTVSFNGQAATPITVSATQITVAVPSGAASGPVSVTSPSGTASSGTNFTVTSTTAPTISGVSPSPVDQGTTITISGSGFDPLPANDKIFLNGRYAAVTSASSTTLTALVPVAASGYVSVTTPNGTATTSSYLVVPPLPYFASSIGSVVQSSIGSAFTSSVASAGQIGMVLFDATAGHRVSMSVTASSFGSATLALYGPDGATITSSAISSGTAIYQQPLKVSGTYTIVIAPSGSSAGSATVQLFDVPPDATAAIAANGTPFSLTTGVAGQNISLTFAGAAGQRVYLNTQVDSNFNFACSSESIVEPDNATMLFRTGVCGGGTNSGVLTLPVTGTYTIHLAPATTGFGTATFTLYTLPPDVTGTIAANGTPVSSTTTSPLQGMSLTFAGTAGQRVYLNTQVDSNFNFACSTEGIVEPDNATMLFRTGVCGGGTNSGVLTLPVTGTYTIQLAPASTGFGTATFTLYTVPPDVTGTIAANAAPVSLTTTSPLQGMSLTFAGTAGQRVYLNTQVDSNFNFACSTEGIVEPDNATMLFRTGVCGGGTNSGVLTLPVTGTYTIHLAPATTGFGTATFTLYTVPPDVTGTIAANGTPVSVTTTAPIQGMSVTFAGTAGQRVFLLTQADSSFNFACSTENIAEPDNTTQLYRTTVCGTGTYSGVLILPVTGTYTIQLAPPTTGEGTATFTLYTVPPDASATITPGGGTVALTTTAPDQNMSLQFAGATGQRVSLLIQVDNNFNFACSTESIVEPDNTTGLFRTTVCGSGNYSGALTLPVTGTYAIQLAAPSTGFGTATFTLYNIPADVSGSTNIGDPASSYTTTVPSQAIRVSFTGAAGQSVAVHVGVGSVTPANPCYRITTLDPDGTTVLRGELSCSSSYSSGSLSLPQSGTYTVVVAPNDLAIGTFSVGVTTP